MNETCHETSILFSHTKRGVEPAVRFLRMFPRLGRKTWWSFVRGEHELVLSYSSRLGRLV